MIDQILFYAKLIGIPLVFYFFFKILYRYIQKNKLVQRIKVPLNIIFLLFSISIFLEMADFPYVNTVRQVNYLILGFCIFFAIIKTLEIFFVEKVLIAERNIDIPVFLRDLVRLFLLVAGIVILLKIIFGIEPSAFIVTSTVLSAVIGLAMQDILSNIVSGIALQFERPFKVGDWVTINEREGKVVEMSWRTTKLRTRDNDYIITPNTAVAKQEIYNFYNPTRLHAIRLDIGTSYQNAPNLVKKSIFEVLDSVDLVLKRPNPQIFLKQYDDFSINYQIRFWIDDYSDVPIIQDQVMTKLWYQFKRDGIQIPFPIRDVNIHSEEKRAQKEQESYQQLLNDIVASIKDIDILEPFSQEELFELAKKARHQIYGRGEYLVKQGEEGCTFFIIKSGLVEVFIQADNTEKSIGTFGEDYYFGEMALLTGECRKATVIAREDTEAIIIDKENFGTLLKNNPEVAETLSEILQKRTQEIQKIKSNFQKSENIPEKDVKKDSKKLLNRIQNFFGI
jgi:small-conductance mechanosensitive channel